MDAHGWTAERRAQAREKFAQAAKSRFWSKVNKNSGIFKLVRDKLSECWTWTGYVDPKGYGWISVSGKMHRAHTRSYLWERGPVPEGLELDHLCRTRHCVRPDHLEAVPHTVNILRGLSQASKNARKLTCPRGHAYDVIRRGRLGKVRGCRTCERARIDTRKRPRKKKSPQETKG